MMETVTHKLTPVRAVVTSVIKETDDTVTITIKVSPQKRPEPGQFAMLYAPLVGESAISFSGIRDGAIEHTIRRVGKVTAVLTSLSPGDVIGWRGPYGKPWPMAEARGRDLIVVAGGIGMAPLRPVIHERIENGEAGRTILLYGARSPDQLLYRKELEEWREAGVDVRLTIDKPHPSWSGRTGFVTELIPGAIDSAHNPVAFVCGPEIMMKVAVGVFEKSGMGLDRVWVSLERKMRCGFGSCGYCQIGPIFVCRHGPTFRADEVRGVLGW